MDGNTCVSSPSFSSQSACTQIHDLLDETWTLLHVGHNTSSASAGLSWLVHKGLAKTSNQFCLVIVKIHLISGFRLCRLCQGGFCGELCISPIQKEKGYSWVDSWGLTWYAIIMCGKCRSQSLPLLSTVLATKSVNVWLNCSTNPSVCRW